MNNYFLLVIFAVGMVLGGASRSSDNTYGPMTTLNNNSDDEDDEEITTAPTTIPKPKKGKNKSYHLVSSHASFELAENEILKEKIGNEAAWAKFKDHAPKKGRFTFYRCKEGVSRGKQCSAACKIFEPASAKDLFQVLRTNCAHDHIQRKLGVPLATRAVIDRLVAENNRIYPSKILEDLKAIPGMAHS